MSGLRLAVLGCGKAARLNAAVLRRLGGVDLCCASRDASRARAFGSEVGAAATFGSYEAALASPDVDAVLVATPPATHRELARRALEAGKHVVLEKPPVLRAAHLDELAEAARATSRRLLVAENYFYKPLARTLRRLLAEGAVGEPLFLHLVALKSQGAAGWLSDPALAGGGTLLEGGIHWVDLLAHLGPEVERVEALAAGPDAPLERSVLLAFRYVSGAVGTLACSWEVPSPWRGLRLSRVYGREGSIAFESNGLFVAVWGRRTRLLFPGLRDIAGRRAMWRDLLAALRGEKDPEFDLARARRDLELVEAAHRSAGLPLPGEARPGPQGDR